MNDNAVIDRFMANVEIKNDSCWMWKGQSLPSGYPRFNVNKKTVFAHRFSHEVFVGPIPDGYEVDHLCRKPGCVNPEHLEAVTPRENWERSNSITRINRDKSHCKNGHPFDEENTYHHNGTRLCKQCRLENKRALRTQKRLRGKLTKTQKACLEILAAGSEKTVHDIALSIGTHRFGVQHALRTLEKYEYVESKDIYSYKHGKIKTWKAKALAKSIREREGK